MHVLDRVLNIIIVRSVLTVTYFEHRYKTYFTELVKRKK